MQISATIDAVQRLQELGIGDVDLRRGLEARADALGGALELERARDGAADGADRFPLGGQRVVAPAFRDGREGLQVDGAIGARESVRARLPRR